MIELVQKWKKWTKIPASSDQSIILKCSLAALLPWHFSNASPDSIPSARSACRNFPTTLLAISMRPSGCIMVSLVCPAGSDHGVATPVSPQNFFAKWGRRYSRSFLGAGFSKWRSWIDVCLSWSLEGGLRLCFYEGWQIFEREEDASAVVRLRWKYCTVHNLQNTSPPFHLHSRHRYLRPG